MWNISQDHERTDHFLIQDAADTRFVGLLTDGSAEGGISQYFSSNTSAHSTQFGGFFPGGQAPVAPTPPSTSTAAAPASAASASASSASSTTKSTSSSKPGVVAPSVGGGGGGGVTSQPSTKSTDATPSTKTLSKATVNPVVSGKTKIRTKVTKGENGIGLDLSKTPEGGVMITRLKEMAAGVINPASLCNPAILAGDIIVGVNGEACFLFADVVKAIRGGVGIIELVLERA